MSTMSRKQLKRYTEAMSLLGIYSSEILKIGEAICLVTDSSLGGRMIKLAELVTEGRAELDKIILEGFETVEKS